MADIIGTHGCESCIHDMGKCIARLASGGLADVDDKSPLDSVGVSMAVYLGSRAKQLSHGSEEGTIEQEGSKPESKGRAAGAPDKIPGWSWQ